MKKARQRLTTTPPAINSSSQSSVRGWHQKVAPATIGRHELFSLLAGRSAAPSPPGTGHISARKARPSVEEGGSPRRSRHNAHRSPPCVAGSPNRSVPGAVHAAGPLPDSGFPRGPRPTRESRARPASGTPPAVRPALDVSEQRASHGVQREGPGAATLWSPTSSPQPFAPSPISFLQSNEAARISWKAATKVRAPDGPSAAGARDQCIGAEFCGFSRRWRSLSWFPPGQPTACHV